jgi:hypothetical protein
MANDILENNIKTSIRNLISIDINQSLNIAKNLQPWNGLDYQDLKTGHDEIIDIMTFVIDNNLLNELPFNILSQINANLINVYNFLLQFTNSQTQPENHKQNIFNSLLNQIDAVRTLLRNNGTYNYVKFSPDIPKMSASIHAQLSNLTDAQERMQQFETDTIIRIKNLENEIRELISPTVAGSLSKSFGNRKKFVFWTRIAFFILTIISIGFGGWYTINTINQIISQITLENIDKLSITYTLLRIFTLFPLYMICGFLYRQYSRERTVEENYAHKETIATIIKTYGELISDQKVKDELLQNASKVIVSSPEKYKFEKQSKNTDNYDMQSLINNLLDLLKAKQ